MKTRVLVLLIVVAALLASVNLVAAQDNLQMTAVAPAAVNVYAEASMDSEVVMEAPASTEFDVLATNRDGSWLATSDGWVMADSVVILNFTATAPLVEVTTGSVSSTALYAAPSFGSEFLGSLDDGQVAKLLGVNGEWAYIQLSDNSRAWSVVSAWSPLDAVVAEVITGSTPAIGLFADAQAGSDLLTTVDDGGWVYWLEAVDDQWVSVLTADGVSGFAIADNFVPMPEMWAETAGEEVGVYAAPDAEAEMLVSLPGGVELRYLEALEEGWVVVYHPLFGVAYVMDSGLGYVYYTTETTVADAVVRAGPSSFTYNGVAQLGLGAEVIVSAQNAEGTWVKVAVPFDELDFPENGTSGWMAEFLFQDAEGASTLDMDLLTVISDEMMMAEE